MYWIKIQKKKIYLINIDEQPLPGDKLQFLKNNYIEPVRLKTIFDLRKGKDDEEYMFEFLNSIMPDDKKYSEYNQKWNKLDIDNIKQVD